MQPKKISENIVKKEMEKIGIPDNAVAEILGFHGGVYGMVPREVWEMTCVPELAVSRIDWMKVVWMGDGACFKDVSGLIRKDNWKINCEERWDSGDIHKTCMFNISIDERNIHDMLKLQSRKTGLRVCYEFFPPNDGRISGLICGEGFLKDYADGEVTITRNERRKADCLAQGSLERFTKLELCHPYRRLCYHDCERDIFPHSDSDDSYDSDYHYELSESDVTDVDF